MPLEETEHQVKFRLRNPKPYEQSGGLIRYSKRGLGTAALRREHIRLLVGKKPGARSTEAQALRFEKPPWTKKKVKEWEEEHPEEIARLTRVNHHSRLGRPVREHFRRK